MAKILIEIDDKTSEVLNKPYHSYTDIHDKLAYPLYKAVRNGVVIPDNATNGDVIRAIFSFTKVRWITESRIGITVIENQDYITEFDLKWWNAPYKVGDTEESDAEFMCRVMSKTVNKSVADNNFIGGF